MKLVQVNTNISPPSLRFALKHAIQFFTTTGLAGPNQDAFATKDWSGTMRPTIVYRNISARITVNLSIISRYGGSLAWENFEERGKVLISLI